MTGAHGRDAVLLHPASYGDRVDGMDEARRLQLHIWRSWTPGRRVAAGTALAAAGWRLREQRLRYRFPGASSQELGWARVRLSLGLPLATTPL